MSDIDWIRTCKDLTRVEVIESIEGRILVETSITDVEASLQDDGKTLKIFIKRKKI